MAKNLRKLNLSGVRESGGHRKMFFFKGDVFSVLISLFAIAILIYSFPALKHWKDMPYQAKNLIIFCVIGLVVVRAVGIKMHRKDEKDFDKQYKDKKFEEYCARKHVIKEDIPLEIEYWTRRIVRGFNSFIRWLCFRLEHLALFIAKKIEERNSRRC